MRSKRLSLVFVAFYFTFVGGSTYYALLFPVRVLHHALVTLLLLWWLVGRLRRGRGLPVTGLNGPIYAAVGAWLLAALAGSDPRMSLEHTWFLLLHVLLFFVAVDYFQRGYQRLVLEALFFMAAGVLFLTGLELADWYFGLGFLPGTGAGWISTGTLPGWQDVPVVRLAMTISTLLAGYTAPLVIVTAAWALTTRQRAYRVILGTMALLLALTVLLTQSRGGVLSLLAAGAVLLLLRGADSAWLRARIAPRWLLAGGGLLAAGLLAGFVWLTLPAGVPGSNAGRLEMLQAAVTLFREQPVTGVGVGLFGRGFREIRSPSLVQDKLASAHNLYLNTAAETGIIGVLAGLALLAAGAWRAGQQLQAAGGGARLRRQAVLAALAGLAVHSLVDVFSITPIVLLVVVLVAYAVTRLPASRLDAPAAGHGQRGPAVVALLLVAGYGIAFFQFDRAQALYMASFDVSDMPQALADTRAAQAIDPHLRLYTLHEAFLLGLTADTTAALAAYDVALRLEPTWDVGWMNRAALAESAGLYEAAFADLGRAAAINMANGSLIHRARLAEQYGLLPPEEIVTLYVEGLVRRFYLELPLSPFWSATALRRQALEQLMTRSFITPEIQYRIRAVHDPAAAAAMVPAAPATAAEAWIAGENALTVRDDPAQAVAYFSQAIAAAPGRGDYYVARARAYLRIDPAAAQRDLQAAGLRPIVYEWPAQVQATLTGEPLPPPTRSVPQEFAAVLYQRPAVFDVYPPLWFP
jgi:tetratricopeptide (TPR) repeat protein